MARCTQPASCQPTCKVANRSSASGSNWSIQMNGATVLRNSKAYFWVLFLVQSPECPWWIFMERRGHCKFQYICGFYYLIRIVNILLFIISVLGDYWGSSFRLLIPKVPHFSMIAVAWVTLCYLNLAFTVEWEAAISLQIIVTQPRSHETLPPF